MDMKLGYCSKDGYFSVLIIFDEQRQRKIVAMLHKSNIFLFKFNRKYSVFLISDSPFLLFLLLECGEGRVHSQTLSSSNLGTIFIACSSWKSNLHA